MSSAKQCWSQATDQIRGLHHRYSTSSRLRDLRLASTAWLRMQPSISSAQNGGLEGNVACRMSLVQYGYTSASWIRTWSAATNGSSPRLLSKLELGDIFSANSDSMLALKVYRYHHTLHNGYNLLYQTLSRNSYGMGLCW